jgi:hypothetical protein
VATISIGLGRKESEDERSRRTQQIDEDVEAEEEWHRALCRVKDGYRDEENEDIEGDVEAGGELGLEKVPSSEIVNVSNVGAREGRRRSRSDSSSWLVRGSRDGKSIVEARAAACLRLRLHRRWLVCALVPVQGSLRGRRELNLRPIPFAQHLLQPDVHLLHPSLICSVANIAPVLAHRGFAESKAFEVEGGVDHGSVG